MDLKDGANNVSQLGEVVTAEVKFVSPQYFSDVVKAKDAEIDKLRKALTGLASASYDVVQRNRQIYMGGTKYTTPTIKRLAEAMFEAHKVLDPAVGSPAGGSGDG